MATINIMIAVDVVTAQATATGSNPKIINQGLYMIDTTGYLGEAEASNELITQCNTGDNIVWTVYPVNPGDNISILLPAPSGLSGQAVSDQIFQKIKSDTSASNTPFYTCVINQGAAVGQYQYSVNFSISGVHYTYDPFVKVLS